MTKDEFCSTIDSFDDLINFCEVNGCIHIIEGIERQEDFDEWVWDQIEGMRRHWFWNELAYKLQDLYEPSTDYFKPTDLLEYDELYADDLDEYVDEVIAWGEEEEFWDEDEEDEDECYDDDDDYNEDEPVFTSEIEIACLIGVA